MHHLKTQLEKLQNEIQQSEQQIEQDMQNLQDTQDKVRELNVKKTTLKRLVDDIQAAQLATQKGRDSAQKEADTAQGVYNDQHPKLNAKLNDQQRQAIQDAIKAVDDNINALQGEANNLKTARDTARDAATQAERAAESKETAYQDAQERLRQLPADIQAAQATVARLQAALKASAANPQKTLEAFYLAGELKGAITQLTALLKPEKESGLVDALIAASVELRTAQDDAADKKVAENAAEAALTAKDRELQNTIRGRQDAIKVRIAAIPAIPAQPAPSSQPQPVGP